MELFLLTCTFMFRLFSAASANSVLFLDPPRFNIERKVNLETAVSCGRDMFQAERVLTCGLFANKGDSANQDGSSRAMDCSACDGESDTQRTVTNVLGANHTREWRSLSRAAGTYVHEINITITLPQVFKLQHITIRAGSTPLPAVWALEQSRDPGSDFEVIRYYAADQEDCYPFFGVDEGPMCIVRPNMIWEEDENVDLLASRIRFRFFRMRSSLQRSDRDLAYYSLGDISIEGRCHCNGHANECVLTDEGRMSCQCQRQTCGEHCEMCCDGYELNETGVCSFVELNAKGTSSPLVSSKYVDKMKNFTETDPLPNVAKADPAGKKDSIAASSWNETSLDGDRNSGAITSSAVVTLPTKSSVSQVSSLSVVFSNENVESANLPGEKVIDVLTVVGNSSPSSSERPTNSIVVEANLTRLNSSQITSTFAPVLTYTPVTHSTTSGLGNGATSTSEESLLDVTSVERVAPWTTKSGTIVPSTTEPSSMTTKVAATKSLLNSGAGNSMDASEKLSNENSTGKHNSTISLTNGSRELQKTSAAPVNSVGESITSKITASGEPTRPISGPTIGTLSTPATTEKVIDESTIPSELTSTMTGTVKPAVMSTTKSPRTTLKPTYELLTKKVTSEFPMKIKSSTTMTRYIDDSNNETLTPVVSTTKQTSLKERTTATTTTMLASGENFANESPTKSKISSVFSETDSDIESSDWDDTTTTEAIMLASATDRPTLSGDKKNSESSFTMPVTNADPTVGDVMKRMTDFEAMEETIKVIPSDGNSTKIKTISKPATNTVYISSTTAPTSKVGAVLSTDQFASEESRTTKITFSNGTSVDNEITQTTSVTRSTVDPGTKTARTSESLVKSTSTEASSATTSGNTATVSSTIERATEGVSRNLGSTEGSTDATDSKAATEPFSPLLETVSSMMKSTTEVSKVRTADLPATVKITSTAHSTETTTEPFPSLVDTNEPSVASVAEGTFLNIGKTTNKSSGAPSTSAFTTVRITTTVSTRERLTTKGAAKSSQAKTTTEPFPSLVDVISKPSPLPKETATEFFPPLGQTTHKNTILKSTAQPSIAKTTTEPFPSLVDVISKSSPLPKETATEFFPPLGETTDKNTILKSTARPSIAKTTTEPFPPLVDATSKPSPLPKETATEFFPPLGETTHKNTILKSTAQPSIAKTTTEPFPSLVDVISKSSPLPKETATEFFPPLGETTHKNTILKSTARPSIAKTTTEPFPPLVDATSKPSPLPKETATEFFPPLGETTHKNTILKSTAQPSIAKTTTEPIPPLVDVTFKPSPLPKETATEFFPPLGETTHKNTILKSTAQPSIAKTTTEPFPPLVDVTFKPSPLPKETATEFFPPLGETTHKNTILKSTAQPSIAKTTTEPFPPLVDATSKPSPLPKETATEFFPPLGETTHKNTILKSTAQPSIAKTTTEPFPPLVDATSKPSPLPKETATEFSPPLGETTHKNTILKSTAQPSIAKTTTEPFPPLVDVTSEPSPLPKETATEFFPPLGETTHKNTILKSTAQPSIAKTTTEPFPPLVDVTSKPSPLPKETATEFFPPLGETTHKNTILKSTAQPSIAKTTTEPFPPLMENIAATTAYTEAEYTTEKTTAMSSTSGVMSEEEARIAFGNLPKGVCYCNKYATVGKQCFPSSLRKPCICKPNYAGSKCEKCAEGYFNPPICAPCRCNKYGSTDWTCDKETGHCKCKRGFRGRKCNACPLGKFNFPTCSPCNCNPSGSYAQICDPYNGQCSCRWGILGRQCNKCPAGYYNFPHCRWCGCNPLTTTNDMCKDQDGGYGYRCLCKPNFKGLFCGECQRGYYDFPICKKCSCSPRGYGSCNDLGRCVCDAGYAGSQCNRCASGYYGFPHCQPCNCNTFGSYSTQCNETTGQCACRPNIRGSHCNRCAVGTVGFPTCVKCECNPDGTKLVPGRIQSMCYGTTKYQCLCKSHVVGRTCDRCMHGYYNFSGSDPNGCSACRCSSRGTISGTRNCHAQNGRCNCKNHAAGAKCDHCKDGYHGMKQHDIFGCKACKCDPGGSNNRNCFKYLGNCRCISGVEGKKCNSLSLSRPLYFPTLYQVYVELEDALLLSNLRVRVPISADDKLFPSFSGRGFAIFTAHKPYAVVVSIPKTTNYRIVFHYALRNNSRTSAKVEFFPKGSTNASYVIEARFSPPKSSKQQSKNLRTTLNSRGRNIALEMTKGTWNVIITSRSSLLLLDYIVFLPEDYYNAVLLRDTSVEPCSLRTSKPESCNMYTYYELKGPSLVTVLGDKAYTLPNKGQIDLFTDTRYDLSGQRFSHMALLGTSQPSIGFNITVQESGPYILMVTYLHPERFTLRTFVRVTPHERGHLEILPCKFLFACRQFVMDDSKRPKYFELKAAPEVNVIRIESSTSSKIAVISVSVIPSARWNTQYIQPELLCRMYNNSCMHSAYEVPPDSIQLIPFSRRSRDKVRSIFRGDVDSAVVYHVIIHYHQPYSLAKRVEVISIADQFSPNVSVTFRFCPANSGCRVVLGGDAGRSFQFIKGKFTATIQHERRTHLAYILLVPQKNYSTSLLELQSLHKVTQFVKNCGKDHFYVDPVQTSRQCQEDVFSLTIGFNEGPLACKCNPIGSKSTFCEQFGGQCPCVPNVVGRICNRCRLGYSGFPRCKRCGCHEVGSLSPTCTTSGRCFCKAGFGGYKCDRCKTSGFYGFPDCKPCACNSFGSLSSFCRSRDGQCQCRRLFQGQKCDECRVGYYDFPRCKECSCNPAGVKMLPGEKNSCGSMNDTHCRCKDNVIGDNCDTCKSFHFNLQITNPLGCQSCACNTNGTLGSIKTCQMNSGQCVCKSHVSGRNCGQCKQGYYRLKGQDVFGCKRCLCDAGGSVGQSCNPVTGACTCLRGVGGVHCDRVESKSFYAPTLHQFKIELEDALTQNDRPAYYRHSESEFSGFSWLGYVVFLQSQTSIYMVIDVPRTSRYQLIFYYKLSRYAPVTALVKFIPTLDSASFPTGPATEQMVDVRFRSTASWLLAIAKFLVVRDNWGDLQQIMLSQGKWKLTMAAPASDLFVDYLVLLPKEYYRPQNLVIQVSKPCTLSRDDKYCLFFTYPSLRQAGFVTIQAEDNSVVGGIRRTQRGSDIPFRGLLLTGSRNVMSVRLPSTIQGEFVLTASYFHNSDDQGILNLVVRTGDEVFRPKMMILSCRYRFGCRQVAIDDRHSVYTFTANSSKVNTVSISTSFTVALDFITAIPRSKWHEGLLLPAEQCTSNGYTCIQTGYPDPTDSVKIEVEDSSTGGDRAPYYIMDRRARLKHIKMGKRLVYVSGTARSGRYYVIVHFYQPHFLSFLGKVVITGQATSVLMNFRYCPYVFGCRAVGTSQYREGMSESIYIGRQNNFIVSIGIPEDKSIWIDYVLLVPVSSFSLSLLEIKPIDVTQDFIQDCGQLDFHLKESSSSKFCLSSAFTITSRFNNGALACHCDRLGSTKSTCQSFGGQCTCRPNVIGRACDRCKSGYRWFPNCRRFAS